MKKQNKYTYYKVIQQNYGQGWEDVSQYETNSTGTPIEMTECTKINDVKKQNISLFRHDFKEYKLTGYPTRAVNRKELN